jgi:hypothetical protein
MRNIIFIILLTFPFALLSQGSNNKFLQLRDFSTGGIDANEFFFVDKSDSKMAGSPYIFDTYIASTLVTKDSAKYYAKATNINLVTNNYELINNGQYFTHKRQLIQYVEFQYDKDSIVVVHYFDNLDKFGILLSPNDLKLVKIFELSVKEPDYRADLNVGSKSPTYRVKDNYYVITPDGRSFLFSSKKDVKVYISSIHSTINAKGLLKGFSFRTESDLIEIVSILNKL